MASLLVQMPAPHACYFFMIPSREPAKLGERQMRDQDYNDFISRCLVKDFTKRPSATELLRRPCRLLLLSACG